MSYTTTVLDQAQHALDEGRMAEAYQIVRPVAEAEPTNVRAWWLLAAATSDRHEAAIARARAAQAAPLQAPPPASPGAEVQAPAAGRVILAGAALIFFGSFLPWAAVRGMFSEQSINGMQADGIITLAGSILIAAAGVGLMVKSQLITRLLGLVLALGIGMIVFINIFNSSLLGLRRAAIERALSGQSSSLVSVESTGAGLYLVLAGVLVVLVGTGLQLVPRRA
jgi:hypothetical protein